MSVSAASGVLVQQLGGQTNAALSALKQNAQAAQALTSMIAEASPSPSGDRGGIIDVLV